MEQGRLASCHMFHQFANSCASLFPYGIYTIPEISMVGQSEQQLTQQNVPYEVGLRHAIARSPAANLSPTPTDCSNSSSTPRATASSAFTPSAPSATELIHIGQTVMAAGMSIDYFVDTVFNYPTLAECYKVAALDGLNRVRAAILESPADAA